MKTTSKLTAALVLAAALVGLGLTTAASADDKPQVSKAASKPLRAVQEALSAKPPKLQDALAKLKEAEAVQGRNAWDDFLMNDWYAFVYTHTQDYASAAPRIEAVLASQYEPATDVPVRVKQLIGIYWNLKNYDKVIENGTRMVQGGYPDDQYMQITADAYYLKNDYPNTLKFTNDFIDSQIKDGKTPKEDVLNLVVSACVKLDDAACLTRAFERMVAYYPKQEYWENLLETMFRSKAATSNDRMLLNVYRLADEVNAVNKPDEVRDMAQLALDAGSPGEAKRVLEKAFANNVFADPKEKERGQRLLDSATKQAAADQAALPKLEAETATATTGTKDVGLGLAYLSYGQYDKAAAALSRGLMKGSLRNETEARLWLGIAQLKAGNKDEATKTFKAVKGDPVLERLANLWTLHARQA